MANDKISMKNILDYALYNIYERTYIGVFMTNKARKIPEINEDDFKKTLSNARKSSEHKEYLDKVLVDYDRYVKDFTKAFTIKNDLYSVYIFRATYLNSEKPIWRELALLGKHTFDDLADEIIWWMSWDNDHMHAFVLNKPDEKEDNIYKLPAMYSQEWEDDPYPTHKTTDVKIVDVNYTKYPKWGFIFDFGDGHEFDVELLRIEKKFNRKLYSSPLPTCIDMRGVSPEQYPPLEDQVDKYGEWKCDEFCPHCNELKKSGTKMQWFPDDE